MAYDHFKKTSFNNCASFRIYFVVYIVFLNDFVLKFFNLFQLTLFENWPFVNII